jgi:transmembrane sensor
LNLDFRNTVQRYITGNASPQEHEQVQQWVNASSDHKRKLEELQWIWDNSTEGQAELDLEKALALFKERQTEPRKTAEITFRISKKADQSRAYLLRIAAILFIAVLLSISVIYQFSNKDTAFFTRNVGYDRIIKTQAGNRTTIMLEDGTEVTLNAASELKIRDDFNTNSRYVALKGEAFFKVASDPTRPFNVHIDKASIQVLGTEFNIRSRSDETNIEVIVREGKVSFVSDSTNLVKASSLSSHILGAGDILRLNKETGVTSVQNSDITRQLLWLEGGLYFQATPFHQVVAELQKHYDVNIIIMDKKLSNIPYTGTFPKARIDEVLYVVAQTVGLEVQFNKDIIELYPLR